MSKHSSPWSTRRIYEFINAHRGTYNVKLMCRTLERHSQRLLRLAKEPNIQQGQGERPAASADPRLVQGKPWDLRSTSSVPRPAGSRRDMQQASSGAFDASEQDHCATRLQNPAFSGGKPAVIAPSLVKRNFDVIRPNKVWVTDITYIRTWQGWLYLAVVIDLFSRLIVGWATGSSLRRELVLDAVMMAVRRRRTKGTVIHSDQGCQYGSDDWSASAAQINLSRA